MRKNEADKIADLTDRVDALALQMKGVNAAVEKMETAVRKISDTFSKYYVDAQNEQRKTDTIVRSVKILLCRASRDIMKEVRTSAANRDYSEGRYRPSERRNAVESVISECSARLEDYADEDWMKE